MLRLVYQDSDGDWLLLQPEAPWQLFQRTVRKLVVQAVRAKAAGAGKDGGGEAAGAAAAPALKAEAA